MKLRSRFNKFALAISIIGIMMGLTSIYAAPKQKAVVKIDKTVYGSSSNTRNFYFGTIMQSGKWIFYSNQDIKNVKENGLYRMSIDGKNVMKIQNGTALWLNVVGNYLYYQDYNDIYRVKLDGTGKQLLVKNSGKINSLNVADNYLYFASGSLYKLKIPSKTVVIDGANKKQFIIVNESDGRDIRQIDVHDSWVYFYQVRHASDEKGVYFRVKTNGYGVQKLKLMSGSKSLDGVKLNFNRLNAYFYYDNYIWQMALGDNSKIVCKQLPVKINKLVTFAVKDNDIYCLTSNGVMKVKIGAKNYTKTNVYPIGTYLYDVTKKPLKSIFFQK